MCLHHTPIHRWWVVGRGGSGSGDLTEVRDVNRAPNLLIGLALADHESRGVLWERLAMVRIPCDFIQAKRLQAWHIVPPPLRIHFIKLDPRLLLVLGWPWSGAVTCHESRRRYARPSMSKKQAGQVFSTRTPPPLAQARPRSQQSGQNGSSTPTPCLDKAVHARDTCDSQIGNNIVSHG